MENCKALIYTSSVLPPYLAETFQEEACRRICEIKGIKDIEVFSGNPSYIFENMKNYSHVIVYSISCFGTEVEIIVKRVIRLMQNTNLISVTDPFHDNILTIEPATQIFLLNIVASISLQSITVWETITRNEKIFTFPWSETS